MPHSPTNISDTELQKAVSILQSGGLVGMPTETVYGLACDAKNPEAIAHLYAVKGRPGNHPVIVHIANANDLHHWAIDIPAYVDILAKAFWPGPMTLILKRHPDVPLAVTGGQETVGIRIPKHPVALQLLNAFGSGLVAPSANRFGKVSPTTAQHVRDDLGNDIPLILDGGACPVGVESTILDCTKADTIRILRPGMLLAESIEDTLHKDLAITVQRFSPKQQTGDIRVSGALESHYAPSTPVRLLSSDELLEQTSNNSAVFSFLTKPTDFSGFWLQAPTDAEAYAQCLYDTLRHLDQQKASEILIEMPPADESRWTAVLDRLRRASA